MLTQTQVAQWATSVLSKSWLYKTSKGYLLPTDVRYDWSLTDTSIDEYLDTRLLYVTAKKAIYRIGYSAGTVDVSVPLAGLGIENRYRSGIPAL